MKIAIITDIPFLCEDTMYINELEKQLLATGAIPSIFVVKDTNSKSAYSATGLSRIIDIVKLRKELGGFDVIHAQFTYPVGFALTLLSKLKVLNKPVIVHTHGYDVFTVNSVNYGIRRREIGRFLTSQTWKSANRIIAVCAKSKIEIEKTGIESDRVDLLYNGVDESLFTKVKPSVIDNELMKLREQNDIILLSVATLVPVKNHLRMIKAFKEFVNKYGSHYKIKLLLIGENISCNSTDDVTESNQIIHLGKIKHKKLPMFYSIADAFVLPSLSEAHPWSLLEAMACELPVIASNVGGIPETIGNSAFLVNPYYQADLQNKLEFIAEMNDSERRRIGLENRKRILQAFTLKSHVSQLYKIYENTLIKDQNAIIQIR